MHGIANKARRDINAKGIDQNRARNSNDCEHLALKGQP